MRRTLQGKGMAVDSSNQMAINVIFTEYQYRKDIGRYGRDNIYHVQTLASPQPPTQPPSQRGGALSGAAPFVEIQDTKQKHKYARDPIQIQTIDWRI